MKGAGNTILEKTIKKGIFEGRHGKQCESSEEVSQAIKKG